MPGAVRGEVKTENWQQLVEAHWLTDEQVRASANQATTISTRADAAGGCDGVKDGRWGFHTGHARQPWWHVDLGRNHTISRVLIWNRCDAESAAHRATNLLVRLSSDGHSWETAYQHNGAAFLGIPDKQPLHVELADASARFVRIELPKDNFLHLDEVEVFGPDAPDQNLALNKPADQVSTSQWSKSHRAAAPPPDWRKRTSEVLAFAEQLHRLGWGEDSGAGAGRAADELNRLRNALDALPASDPGQSLFVQARRLQRQLALKNPLLDFEAILFTKRVPPSFNHMSDQYYGWWSEPGGGIFLLRNFKGGTPETECLTGSFTEPGSFLRPTLSYDGRKVLFAWCRYYPGLAAETNKLDKANVPEDAFYHLFEMDIDGTNVRRLTRGKYDDFDGRYLPDGRIVFLSTRRGQALQTGRASASRTLATPDLPDSYVRCGGGPERPVAVYTLHTMNADGTDLCAISPFEMFEWTPEIAHDGSILYSRWDYVDRDNMPYMGLWAMNPDGSNARIVYGNFTRAPHCAFEPMPVPNSHKIVFTASAHHAHTMGSLVLLDPAAGVEGKEPLTRLTPEVPFPEIEEWPSTSYASPWPLSERFYLVAWGYEGLSVPGPEGWDRWHAVRRPPNGMALYWFDAAGGKELLYRDPAISCGEPIPVRPRPVPPMVASQIELDEENEGRFLLADVYQGLKEVPRGTVTALRLVAVPAKTHPTMNFPNMGITSDDPGKCVLGTVPVEEDGSAYFRAPAGVTLFFQALDARGVAVQSMRSATHVQPGQTVSCIGCHESRMVTPPVKPALAAFREPSKIAVGPEGSWPIHFGRLVQPVLDRHCVSCHSAGSKDPEAAKYDLSPTHAYDSLVSYGKPSLRDQVMTAYRQGFTAPREGIAEKSALLAVLDARNGHYDAALSREDRERLLTWIDTYAQRLGAFSPAQEAELEELRRASAGMLLERPDARTAAWSGQ